MSTALRSEQSVTSMPGFAAGQHGWARRLRQRIFAVLVLKLTALLVLWAVFFSSATKPTAAAIRAHWFDSSPASSVPASPSPASPVEEQFHD